MYRIDFRLSTDPFYEDTSTLLLMTLLSTI